MQAISAVAATLKHLFNSLAVQRLKTLYRLADKAFVCKSKGVCLPGHQQGYPDMGVGTGSRATASRCGGATRC